MLKLYNKEHEVLSALTNLKDYKIEYVLSGEDLLEFSLSRYDENIPLIEEECYIRTKYNEYVIKAIEPSDNFKRFTCNINIESLVGKVIKSFDTKNNNINDTIRLAIAGTGWTLADNSISKKRTVSLKNTNALEVLRKVRETFRVDFRFDAINKIIYVYEKLGSDKGVYFTDELNLISLDVPSDSYDYATRLYAKGKDGLTFADINNGKDYIENFQYSNKIIEKIWEDNRYTNKQNLKEDAEAKLEELSKPRRNYNVQVYDLAKNNSEFSFLDFSIGDTVTIISNLEKFKDKQRIVKYIEYPEDPSKNTCELGNTTLTFEELQKVNEAKNQVVENITSDNGTVDGSKVDSITTEQISDFEAEVAKITDLTVINAEITNLKAQNVTITGKLTAIEGEFGTLKANVGVIDKLTVTHTAQINSLEANKASITQLNAVSANIGSLEVEVGKIQTLVNGNLSSENIQAGGITSDKLTIANGFITNAMISNLDVSKINAGDISTNKFRIVSDSGKMLISDNTIQISDNNRVRVQIGKDASNDYNMYVWDSNGKLMFDATGLKADGIKNKIIRDDMISDNANIDGGKINISSLITEINKDTNTSVIKSSKVQLDTVGQTLEVAFNSLKSNVDNIEIGGKNLLISSKLTTYAPYNSLEKTTTGTDKIVSKWNPTYTGNTFTLRNNDSKPISGVHTFSGYIKVNGEIPTKPYFQTISTYYGYMIENYYDSTTGYFRIVQKQGGTSTWIIHASTSRTSGSADIVEITKAKLEKGNKATDWTQAPEDAQGQIDTVKEITESHSTTIGVMQGQITTAINNTQIVKDGQTILLKDDYNRTVQTVNSMNSTIGSHTTKINEHTGKITGVETKTNELERTLNSVSSRLSSTETTVSNHTASINAVDGKINTAKNQAIVDSRKLIDTRNTNENPGWYLTNYPRQTIVEFKTFKVLGISSSIAYGTLTTNVPWADSSGGYPVQTFRSNSGGTYERKGVSTTEWGTWKQVEDTSGSQNKATQALNDAKGYTNGEITKVNITITTTNNKVSAIEQSMESITQRVSSTETKVITVTNTANSAKTQADKAIADATSAQSTANSANSKIDGLQIGGENLVPNSDFYITSGSKTGLDMSIYKELFEKNRGKQITCSLDVKLVNAIGTGNSSQRVGMEFSIKYKDGTMLYIGAWQYLSTTPITMNTRISRTTTILDKEIEAVYSMGVYIQGLGGGSVQVGRPQVELGSKASSWKKSTRDMETEISSTKSKVSSIETNLSGITQRVSTVEKNQTSVNGKVTSLESWKKSAESKLTKEGLTTIISNHYTTSNDVNGIVTSKGYQTASQVQQTVDALQLKFTQSGGYNLLYNGNFKRRFEKWSNASTSSTKATIDTTLSCPSNQTGIDIKGELGVTKYVQQNVINLNSSEKFTVSLWRYTSSSGVDGTTNPFRGVQCTVTYTDNTKTYPSISRQTTFDKWEYVSLTLSPTTGKRIKDISVGLYNRDTTKNVYYTDVMLTKGSLALPFSPNPNEVFDGVTTIDKDGIKVTQSNINGYTKMTADGFYLNKDGEDVFKVTSSGAYFKGSVIITSGSVPDSAISSTLKNSISTAQSTANTAKTNAANAQSTANTAKTTADNSWSRIGAWTYPNTTVINGGKIQTGSITANQIAANAITADKLHANAINGKTITGANLRGGSFFTAANSAETDGYNFRIYSDGRVYSKKIIQVYGTKADGDYSQLGPDRITSTGYVQCSGYKTDNKTMYFAVDGADVNNPTGDNGRRIKLMRTSEGNTYFAPDYPSTIRFGTQNYMWNIAYVKNGVSSSSDRTLKENIHYISENMPNIRAIDNSDKIIREKDLYNFVKDNLFLAQFNFIGSDETTIGFIAQDLLYNKDGFDDNIGQLIVNKPDSEQAPLTYNEKTYANVLAGALRQAILKIEKLEESIAKYIK